MSANYGMKPEVKERIMELTDSQHSRMLMHLLGALAVSGEHIQFNIEKALEHAEKCGKKTKR